MNDSSDPAGFRRIVSLSDLDDYTDMIVDDERGAFVGQSITENCTMYRDVIGGTRMMQFETAPGRADLQRAFDHLPMDAVQIDMYPDPTGFYYFFRCESDAPI